jgi:heme o synthase
MNGMKALAQPVGTPIDIDKGMVSVWSDLIKARLTFLVLMTAGAGFYMGLPGEMEWAGLLHLLLGTGLVAASAAALNQWLEREHDAKMPRTEDRPLPSGRLRPETVLWAGATGALAGLGYLTVLVSPMVAGLGAVTLTVYLFVYTPLKRVTWLNTAVGAVPGALPPLMGWVAARGGLEGGGWLLFGILALWQIPHFLAIAWLYRDDYARAGYAMLPAFDPMGRRTARHALGCALLLVGVSVMPAFWGMAGWIYLAGALVLGLGFSGLAAHFMAGATEVRARRLFYGSILYLPALLGLLALDKS